MIKPIKYLVFFVFTFTVGFSQTLCPPAFLVANSGNTEIDLSWTPPDTAYYGDILVAECFSDCDSAINAFNIEHVVDNNSGGWFRYSDGEPIDCGGGMLGCVDGGDDDFSAIGYYPSEGSAVDSRLITDVVDLTSYTTATLEFVETYDWYEYQNDSNLVEVSSDSGATWNTVYISYASVDSNAIVARTFDLSSYAGQSILVAFRHIDTAGDGENWYIDNIRIWGGSGGRNTHRVLGQTVVYGKKGHQHKHTSIIHSAPEIPWNNGDVDRDSPCGTFQSYNVFQDGSLLGNVTMNEYSVTGLTNDQTYCFTVSAVYAEGESDTCFNVCAYPKDPFIITPLEIDASVGSGELVTETISITNNEEDDIDLSIFSMSVANLEVATEIMSENFDMGLWGNMYDAGLVWHIGDSTGASSVYLDYPESEGLFAYYNDDADTDTGPPRDLYLASNIIEITGEGNVYLMMDMFYPQSGGPCGNTDIDDGFYADHSSVLLSTDWDQTTYEILIDSSYVNMAAGWQKLIYNITPYTTGNTIVQVAVRYTDCDGNWGYGIGVDNAAIKQGDDISWLTLSPVETTVGAGETVNITVGMYGVSDGFTGSETVVLTADPYEVNVSINMSVATSGIDLPDGIPGQFTLHQNYPNPFNPITNIRFDIPELSFARMDIYNMLGQRVRTLFHGAVEPGFHVVQWDGKNDLSKELPAGIYMYKLHAGNYASIQKLVLLK